VQWEPPFDDGYTYEIRQIQVWTDALVAASINIGVGPPVGVAFPLYGNNFVVIEDIEPSYSWEGRIVLPRNWGIYVTNAGDGVIISGTWNVYVGGYQLQGYNSVIPTIG
jgi:hypothetical protein